MRVGATLTRLRDRVARGRGAHGPQAAVPDGPDTRRTAARGATSVGVDIGSAWIKIVEVAGDRDGLSVRARVTVPTPPGTVRSGRISFPPVVGRVLRDTLSHAGIRTRRTVASVSGHVSLVREVRLPRLSGDELREAARFEVMRYLPYPITEATYDAFVLGETPGQRHAPDGGPARGRADRRAGAACRHPSRGGAGAGRDRCRAVRAAPGDGAADRAGGPRRTVHPHGRRTHGHPHRGRDQPAGRAQRGRRREPDHAAHRGADGDHPRGGGDLQAPAVRPGRAGHRSAPRRGSSCATPSGISR